MRFWNRYGKIVSLLSVMAMHELPLSAYETTTVNGITWTYTVSNDEVSLGGDDLSRPAVSTSTSGAITIPSSLDGYKVTKIDDYAFFQCNRLTSVTIPDSVTSIGSVAFGGCRGLTSVHITDLAKWCGISFDGSEANPLYYAHALYFNGEKITDLVIPDSVTSIGNNAFCFCSGLTNVTIPNSVTNIGYTAFYGCHGLTSVTIPDSVTSIGRRAFYNCDGLTSVTIPSRWALSSVFTNSYTKIVSVTIPPGSDRIADEAFKGCSSLTSVSIPDTVTSIGNEAFCNCTALRQLTIPDSVTSYGVNCFEGCPAYTLPLYRTIFNGNSGSGSSVVVTTVVQNVAAPYALTETPGDRAIASVAVDRDCSIDEFILSDGKVYDSVLRIANTSDSAVKLTLPDGYSYEAFDDTMPLIIPPNSVNLLTLTRTADKTFLVSRRRLKSIER